MTSTTSPAPAFGDAALLDGSRSALARRLAGSTILKIASQVRAMIAAGQPVCNLTVGDFDPRQFPIPEPLLAGVRDALARAETNYPPSNGVLALRETLLDYVEREQGVRYPLESVLVTSGGRPVVYAAFRAVVDAGDTVVYAVPSWNNDHYANMVAARTVELPGARAAGFQPTLEQLRPHLAEARLLCLCTPGNPTGTVIPVANLRAILSAVVDENARRQADGERFLFVLFDQMYGSLVFPPAEHVHPVALVPESAPYVITLDGISKAFAATGLRVGWAMAAPPITRSMSDFLGHVGTWAPRPEQVATARFLADPAAVEAFRETFRAGIKTRLDLLYDGFRGLRKAGYPVDCIDPQGAIYLSLQLDLVGRTVDGTRVATNEAIRHLLLEHAGLAVVPFQAFGLQGDTGWFRMSVGAVSPADIEDAFPRVRALLDRVR